MSSGRTTQKPTSKKYSRQELESMPIDQLESINRQSQPPKLQTGGQLKQLPASPIRGGDDSRAECRNE